MTKEEKKKLKKLEDALGYSFKKKENLARALTHKSYANEHKLPIVARGAGTGLSGGAVAAKGGLVVGFSRMKKIVDVDIPNQRAVVQPGVVNLDLSEAVQSSGYYYAPDPSSQKACTIGGNVAENSGGPHTLAYGVTTNHVLGLEVVLPEGAVLHTGGKVFDWSARKGRSAS